MPKYLSVGEFCDRHARDVPRAVVSNGFVRNWFNSDACPLVAGRRMIPEEYVFSIRAELKRRGYQCTEQVAAPIPA